MGYMFQNQRISALLTGFSLKLHQISHWRTDNHQSKAVCIRLLYLSLQTVHRKKFLVSWKKEKTPKKRPMFLQTATSVKFPDKSHLNQRSQQEQRGVSVCFGTDSCYCKHISYHSQILSLKSRRKEACWADSWKNALMCSIEQTCNSFSHGSLQPYFQPTRWREWCWIITASLK